MPATVEQIAELRADVRHIIATLDRISGKQDELFNRFGDHVGEDTKEFAAVRQEMAIAAAEKRGQTRAARMVYAAGVTVLSFVAALLGGHVKLPGLH